MLDSDVSPDVALILEARLPSTPPSTEARTTTAITAPTRPILNLRLYLGFWAVFSGGIEFSAWMTEGTELWSLQACFSSTYGYKYRAWSSRSSLGATSRPEGLNGPYLTGGGCPGSICEVVSITRRSRGYQGIITVMISNCQQ